jgi:hypothetical protein
VLLAVVVGLFFAPLLTFRGVLFLGDVGNYTSRLAFTGDWIRKGVLPLWNPFLSLGGTHAGDTLSPVFYPPHPLLAVALGSWLYGYDAALHVFVAAIGTFALGRRLELTRPAALMAATVYALGGFTFGHLQHLNVIVGLAWIPVVLAATDRYLAAGDRRSLGLGALAMGLLALGGHVQITLYGLLGWIGFSISRLPAVRRGGAGGRLLGRCAGLLALGVVGLALAAVFLLPFAEWLQFVARAERFSAQEAMSYSLPPHRLATLVAPFWFGGSAERPSTMLVEWSAYVGVFPLALTPVALMRPSGRVLFFLGLAVAALTLALGENSPLYSPLLSVPVLGWVRAPARFLVLAVLAVALLSGFGFDALRIEAGRRAARIVAAGLLFLALGVAYAGAHGKRATVFLPIRRAHLSPDQSDIVLFATLAGAAGLVWLFARRGPEARFLTASAFAFTVADLFAYKSQLHFNELAAGGFDRPSATAQAIRRDGGSRFYTLIEREPWRTFERRRDLEAYRLLMWEGLRNSLPMRVGLQSLTGLLNEPHAHAQLVALATHERGEFDSRSARLTGAFGIRYLITAASMDVPEMTLVSRGMLGLYRNEVAVPRAYLVPESRAVPNADDALALVRLPDFDPRRTVVVEAQGPAMPDAPLGAADVVIVHEEPDRVAMETACVRAAWLVLNDTFAPGWTATIDGQPAALSRANGLVRTVAVGAGRHRVEFLYAPSSVRWGAWISGAALTAVGFLVVRPGARLTVRLRPMLSSWTRSGLRRG